VFTQVTNYTLFEWDVIRLGFVGPLGHDNLTGGLSIGGEIRFNIRDDISLGIGSETVFFNVENLENLEDDKDATVGISTYSAVVGDYYFNTTSTKRAFVGIGFGYTDVGDIKIDVDDEDVTHTMRESGGIVLPRIGYELDHVRFLLNYNFGLKDDIPDFVCLKVALTLWGGNKK